MLCLSETDSDASPWYLKLLWVLYYLSTTSAIVVTLLSIVTTDKGNVSMLFKNQCLLNRKNLPVYDNMQLFQKKISDI